MRFLGALLATAAMAFGQTTAEPEIRGKVQEFGSNAPVAAAEVILKEFVLVDNIVTPKIIASSLSNTRGEFSFKPGHVGSFYIETTKAGYEDATLREGTPSAELSVQLTDQSPTAPVKLILMRPGEIVGRVVDAAGEPIANLRMTMESPGQLATAFSTDAEGKFHLNVVPSAYVIQTASRTPAIDLEGPTGSQYVPIGGREYSDEAFRVVDEQYESLYWPGGTLSPDAALPVQVAPGAVASLGTITLRKVPSYHARVSLEGECSDSERWNQSIVPFSAVGAFAWLTNLNCEKQLFVSGLQPGTFLFAAWSKQHWAQTSFTVVDRNIDIKLTVLPAVQVEGRVILPEGMDVASMGAVHITANPGRRALGYRSPSADVARDGKFLLRDVLWSEQTIVVLTQNSDLYVKQIRYGGSVLAGSTFAVAPQASLEILLDNGAASISGTAMDSGVPGRGTMLMARWPLTEPVVLDKWMSTLDDGTFTMSGLAPGEYRIVALSRGSDSAPPPQDILKRLFAKGMAVKLERGERKSVEIKLTEP